MYESLSKPLVGDLWEKYMTTKSTCIRNNLVVEYSYIVQCIVSKMSSMWKNQNDIDDLVNQGMIALIHAVEKFDASKGAKFETFASIKIKGAIIDYIRAQDWVPRRVRKVANEFDKIYNFLYTQLEREPTQEEIAAHIGISLEQLEKNRGEAAIANIIYFDELILSGSDDNGLDFSDNDIYAQPEKSIIESEFKQNLVTAIDNLDEKEKTIVSLYYYEQLKFKEIAYVMNVSASRVSQLHSNAMSKLKRNINQTYNI